MFVKGKPLVTELPGVFRERLGPLTAAAGGICLAEINRIRNTYKTGETT
jgi:hypothetical protein